MSVVDELVTKIRFEVEHLAALTDVEKNLDRIKKRTDDVAKSENQGSKSAKEYAKASKELNKEQTLTNEILDGTGKVVGGVVNGVKSLGIVASITGGLMAAWGVNAGKSAMDITKVGFAAQLTTQDVQRMSSVYRQMGLSQESFMRDAIAFQSATGQILTLEKSIELADRFSTMSEQTALNAGRAVGLSDETIMVWRQGGEALQLLADNADRLGHVQTDEQIKALTDFQKQWNTTWETVKGVLMWFQSEVAPGLTKALGVLNEVLVENARVWEHWGDVVGRFAEEYSSELDVLLNLNAVKEAAAQPASHDFIKAQVEDLTTRQGYYQGEAEKIAQERWKRRAAFIANPEDENNRNLFEASIPNRTVWVNELNRRNKEQGKSINTSTFTPYDYADEIMKSRRGEDVTPNGTMAETIPKVTGQVGEQYETTKNTNDSHDQTINVYNTNNIDISGNAEESWTRLEAAINPSGHSVLNTLNHPYGSGGIR